VSELKLFLNQIASTYADDMPEELTADINEMANKVIDHSRKGSAAFTY